VDRPRLVWQGKEDGITLLDTSGYIVVLNHLLPFSALSRHNFLFLFFYFFSVHIEWVWGGRFSHDLSPTVSEAKIRQKGDIKGYQ
jgi:hypothetical protein